jgi:hypothetical protein
LIIISLTFFPLQDTTELLPQHISWRNPVDFNTTNQLYCQSQGMCNKYVTTTALLSKIQKRSMQGKHHIGQAIPQNG